MLKDGVVAERGKHAQLLAKPAGIYADMWEQQSSAEPESGGEGGEGGSGESREDESKGKPTELRPPAPPPRKSLEKKRASVYV